MNLPPASARTLRARAPAATATVWGGGLVGTCCALALQARGWQVTVVEATASQVQTSGGNAGVLSRSSLIPLNTPALRRQLPGAQVRHFSFKAMKPIFDIAPFHVCGRLDSDKTVKLWAVTPEGHIAMDASAELA